MKDSIFVDVMEHIPDRNLSRDIEIRSRVERGCPRNRCFEIRSRVERGCPEIRPSRQNVDVPKYVPKYALDRPR